MSSTLCIRRTPKPDENEWRFKLPIKGLIARKFYDHDGSLGGQQITVGPAYLGWFEGILAAGHFADTECRALEQIIEILREGDTIDLWFVA